MSKKHSAQDPLEFVRGMWNNMGFSLPGMVAPTIDLDELDKRIGDLKAVENWLKINLNILQMTVQGLEVQRAALAAVKAMRQHAAEADESGGAGEDNPFAAAAMWPWNFMNAQQPPEQDNTGADAAEKKAAAEPPPASKPRSRSTRKPPAAKR